MKLTDTQRAIVEFVKDDGHKSQSEIAEMLGVAKSEIRGDLALLTTLEILGARQEYGYYYQGKKNYILFAELLKSFPIENIMSMPVIVEERTSVYDAIVMMFLENVGSIYITKNGNLVGVVSRKDLLRAAIGTQDLNHTPVNVVMTRMPNIKTVEPETSVFECAKMLVESQIDGVPVIERDINEPEIIRVVGRVTKTNITNLFVRMGNDYFIEGMI
ncbi:MAG: CBS domain-containing protein [Tissierellia bacterium]|nr:CBS domain-containing protein [Tissierellia bacterium]